MIIGYNFFGHKFHGNIWDTAVPIQKIDEIQINQGVYDEIYLSLNGDVKQTNERPTYWDIKDIIDAKFQDNLEAGTITGGGYAVTKIQIYRRRIDTQGEWVLIGESSYELDYNLYSFVDRFAENGATYEYAIAPMSSDILGDITISNRIKVDYDGIYISDLDHNYQLEYDVEFQEIKSNTNHSVLQPINSRYPIVTFSATNYKTGSATFLPMSDDLARSGGSDVDANKERATRDSVVEFLNSPHAKIIRQDNGSSMIVVTHDVSETPMTGNLINISNVSFGFTEIGDFTQDVLRENGLIGGALKSNYTFTDSGNVIWVMEMNDE